MAPPDDLNPFGSRPGRPEAGDDVARTLLYWMDVEALTPPGAEDDRDTDARGTFEARHVPDRAFPWHDGAFGHPDKRYRHFVRFGVFGRERYQAEIIRALSTVPELDHDTRPAAPAKRFGFAGVFAVDHGGMAIPDSLLMPAFGLAFESLRSRAAPDLDDQLEAFRRQMRATFNEVAEAYAGAERKVDEEFVDAVREVASETLMWLRDLPRGLPLAVVRSAVASVLVEVERKDATGKPVRLRRERHRKAELPPVDSFYFEDIRLVLRAVRNGNGGLAPRFLAGTTERIDCTDRAFVAGACTASSHPRARWPSAHDLSLMQQVAVDLATDTLSKGGLFSVNGPPGTGKTTLLMDLVAAVVLHQAEAMCAFRHPADAFERDRWDAPSGGVHGLHPSLRDHLIVVASSNNAAVENVTRELPNARKVDRRYLDGLDFLAAAADALLARPPDEDEPEDGDEADDEDESPEPDGCAWGLISAALGKKSNRGRFAAILDRHERTGPRKGQPSACNIFRLLADVRRTMNWETERAAFKRAVAEVEALRAELCAAEGDNGRAAAEARVAALEREAGRLATELQGADRALKAATADLAEASAAFERADKSVDLVRDAKPSALLRAFRWDMSSRWKQELSAIAALRADADRRLGAAQATRREAHRVREALAASCDRMASDLASARREAARMAEQAAALATRHGGLVTVADVANATDPEAREQMLPGSSDAFKDARARLFAAAMRLHLAFVCAAGPDLFDRNLRAALAMLRGRGEIQPVVQKAAEHLWATLALVVPVVSTTFASLPRGFAHMGAGSIPWLLVDEAGQAVPHQALGSIWRARRAVVVGDPFQVEPVVAMDRNADAKLAERRGAPDRHRATLASAQTLVDAANPFGAWVQPRAGRPVWVGCPLRVHRRCAEPMFGISNRLAYDGGMVLARGKMAEEDELARLRPLLGESRWFDVAAKGGGAKHFIPEQAEVVLRLVRAYADQGFVGEDGLPALFVVSPFRSVVDGTRKMLCGDLQARGHAPKAVGAWGTASVGTVHTFQGKEKETVILALGGASDGAIAWACGTSNILNVAVTRAQRRLYVVGDRARWMAASSLLGEFSGLPVEMVDFAAEATMTHAVGPHDAQVTR